MVRYLIRRLLWVFVLLIAVSFITFIIFYTLPSADPAQLRAGRQPNPELVEQIRERLGLDNPWYQQYYDYMKAAVLWLIAGVAVGIISAVRSRSALDRTTMGLSLVAISAPVYWLGLVALYLFAPDFGVVPLPFVGGQGSYVPFSDNPGKWMESLILPWFVLATTFAAVYARLLRGSLLDVLGEDYIRTARAKGLRERTVVLKHGVRSAITPVVTVLGLDIGILLGGAILTESVFNIPGI